MTVDRGAALASSAIPTLWSLFFGEAGSLPPDVARRLRHAPRMERLRDLLRGRMDATGRESAEQGVGDALRKALEESLLEVLLRVWRDHPGPSEGAPRTAGEDALLVLGLGEHEVVSTHRPRVDVVGEADTIESFPFDLRLELMVQSATLRIDPAGRIARVSIGACSGSGTLHLDLEELAAFRHDDIRFPDEMAIEAGPPGSVPPGPTLAAAALLPGR